MSSISYDFEDVLQVLVAISALRPQLSAMGTMFQQLQLESWLLFLYFTLALWHGLWKGRQIGNWIILSLCSTMFHLLCKGWPNFRCVFYILQSALFDAFGSPSQYSTALVCLLAVSVAVAVVVVVVVVVFCFLLLPTTGRGGTSGAGARLTHVRSSVELCISPSSPCVYVYIAAQHWFGSICFVHPKRVGVWVPPALGGVFHRHGARGVKPLCNITSKVPATCSRN